MLSSSGPEIPPRINGEDERAQTTIAENAAAIGVTRESASNFSRDGRYIAFWPAAAELNQGEISGRPDVFIYDVVKRTTTIVSVGTVNIRGKWQ